MTGAASVAVVVLLAVVGACSKRREEQVTQQPAVATGAETETAAEAETETETEAESTGAPDPMRSAKVVESFLRQQAPQIMACYDDALRADPSLPAGRLTASFVVAPTGEVTSSTGSGISPAVSSCVAGVIARIQFPVSEDAEDLVVNYPFTFRKTPKR